MDIEFDSNSCMPFTYYKQPDVQSSHISQPLRNDNYFPSHSITFGQDLSKLQQYHYPPFENGSRESRSSFTSSQSTCEGRSYGSDHHIPLQPNVTQIPPQNGENIFANRQSNNIFPQLTGNNIFTSRTDNNINNIFAQNRVLTGQLLNQQNEHADQNKSCNQQNNYTGINVFQTIPVQNQQNNIMKGVLSLNELAGKLFPSVQLEGLGSSPQKEETKLKNDDNIPEKQDSETDEEDFTPEAEKTNEDDDDSDDSEGDNDDDDDEDSSETSCDEESSQLTASERSFNLEEYLRVRDQL